MESVICPVPTRKARAHTIFVKRVVAGAAELAVHEEFDLGGEGPFADRFSPFFYTGFFSGEKVGKVKLECEYIAGAFVS